MSSPGPSPSRADTLRSARPSDWPDVRRLLDDAGLPRADLTERDMRDFLVADAGGTPVGAVGLQQTGHIGLLRSLVVAPSRRGSGSGSRLVAALEARARELGVGELWLLTIDAGEFFAGLGYRPRRRSSAPPAIRDSAEFSSLCPADAAIYSKRLPGPARSR